MSKQFTRGLFACLSLAALASCQDYEAGFDTESIKQAEYAKNFEQIFGKIDPNQDWNMAQQISATMNLQGVSGSAVVRVYEVDPLATVGAKYLADVDVVDGKATWKFDAPKTDKELFVQVKQGVDRVFAGFCTIVDGQLVINNDSFHKRTSEAGTRAMGTGVGAELWTELCFEPTLNSDAILVNTNYYQNHVEQMKIGSDGKLYYSSDITSVPFRELAYNNDTQDGYFLTNNRDIHFADGEKELAISGFYAPSYIEYVGGKYQFKSDAPFAHKAHVAHAYAITSDTETVKTKWLIGDCKDLFWEGDAPFAEGEDYRNSKHLDLYAENGTSLAEIEKGVIFTTSKEDAEIDIPMMYGVTDKSNILGYYYYTEGQDPRDVNRYVLYADARPSTNIKVDDKAVEGMELQQKQSYWTDASIVSCTTRSLMYFGPNGESAGTTKFPKDVKIGFFIRRQDTNISGKTSLPGAGGWAFSDPTLNYQHIYDAKGPNLTAQGTNWTYRGSRSVSGVDSDTSKGNVKAICWNYGGRILVGFGDDTGDCDLNDFVFWVNGDVIDPSKVKIGVKDEEDIYEWMVACEDLGSTDDYDFNDVVFGVKHYTRVSNIHEAYYDKATDQYISTVPTVIEKTNYLVVTPYAAGGSLKSNVYYGTLDLGEIHSLIRHDQAATYASMASGSMPILNAEEGKPQYVGTPVVITLTDDAEFTMSSSDMGGFMVKTSQTGGETEGVTIKAPLVGGAPQMMVLPTGWNWPTERNRIYNVYSKFENWTSDMTEYGWIDTPEGSYVQNPYQSASTGGSGSGSGSGSGGGQTPSKIAWPISIEGPNEVLIRTTADYTISIEGVDDLSGITVGTETNTQISVSKSNDGTTVTVSPADTQALGAASFYVEYEGDETHKTTRLTFNLTIVGKTAVFSAAIGSEPITKGCTFTTTVGTTNLFINLTGENGEWDKNSFYFSSEDEDVVKFSDGANAYSHTITVGNTAGETTVHIKRDADATWNAIDIPFTFKVNAAGTPGGGGSKEPEIDYAQYGTELTISNGIVSKAALKEIATEGPVTLTFVGTGTAWQTPWLTLQWDGPTDGGGHMYQNLVSEALGSQLGGSAETIIRSKELTAEQFAKVVGDDNSGGLKIELSNVSNLKVLMKKN